MVDLWLEQNKLSHNCLSRDIAALSCVLCLALCCVHTTVLVHAVRFHMPWTRQEELQRTKARLVREQRERTLRRQRQLLFPAEELYNSDSDCESESEIKTARSKSVPLSKYKWDLCLTNVCSVLLSLAVSCLVFQYLLIRRA